MLGQERENPLLLEFFEPVFLLKRQGQVILQEFLCLSLGRELLTEKGREVYKKIVSIQRKVRNRKVKFDTKVGLLLTYWDKLYGSMQVIASQSHDC